MKRQHHFPGLEGRQTVKRGQAVATIPWDKVTRVQEGTEESSQGTEQVTDLKVEVTEDA